MRFRRKRQLCYGAIPSRSRKSSQADWNTDTRPRGLRHPYAVGRDSSRSLKSALRTCSSTTFCISTTCDSRTTSSSTEAVLSERAEERVHFVVDDIELGSQVRRHYYHFGRGAVAPDRPRPKKYPEEIQSRMVLPNEALTSLIIRPKGRSTGVVPRARSDDEHDALRTQSLGRKTNPGFSERFPCPPTGRGFAMRFEQNPNLAAS